MNDHLVKILSTYLLGGVFICLTKQTNKEKSFDTNSLTKQANKRKSCCNSCSHSYCHSCCGGRHSYRNMSDYEYGEY